MTRAKQPVAADFPVNSIEVGVRLRRVDEAWVEGLAAAIEVNGFTDPILVATKNDGTCQLIDGAHRLAACRMLGIATIPVIVVAGSDDELRLLEIDANLIRHELCALDRAVFLAERKELYEWLHPESKHGGDRQRVDSSSKNQVATVATWSFSQATAEKIGLSERAIRRAVQIAEGLAPEIRDRAAAMPIAGKQSELLALARQEPERQAAVLDALDRAGDPAPSVRAALAEIEGKPVDAGERDFARLMDAWKRAGPKARRRFREYIDGPACR